MDKDPRVRANRIGFLRQAARHDEPRRRSLQARDMKLVILDRDGTINHDSDHYIKSLDEWRADQGQPRGDRAPDAGRLPRRGGDQPVGHRARPVRHARRCSRSTTTLQRAAAQVGGPHRRVLLLPARRRRRLRVPQAASRACCSRSRGASTSRSRTPTWSATRCATSQAAAAAGARPVLVLTGKGKKTHDEGNLPPGTRGVSRSRRLRRAPRAMTLAALDSLRGCAAS